MTRATSCPGTRRRAGRRTPASRKVVLESMNGGPLSLMNKTRVSSLSYCRCERSKTMPTPWPMRQTARSYSHSSCRNSGAAVKRSRAHLQGSRLPVLQVRVVVALCVSTATTVTNKPVRINIAKGGKEGLRRLVDSGEERSRKLQKRKGSPSKIGACDFRI